MGTLPSCARRVESKSDLDENVVSWMGWTKHSDDTKIWLFGLSNFRSQKVGQVSDFAPDTFLQVKEKGHRIIITGLRNYRTW
jgi:hypothetical protein